MRYALIIGLFLCGMAGSVAYAVDPLAGVRFDQPLEITSQKLEVYQDEQKTVFSGQVEARQEDFQLNADRLTVYYNEQQNQIERLEADGSVRVEQLERKAQADHALFKQAEQLLILTGNAVLQQGVNRVSGAQIVFDLANNTSIVKSAGSGRVKATIMPPKKRKYRRVNHHLRAVDLQKSYAGRQVVAGVSLEVSSGQVIGLLGPNGAGKTTSFYMVVGLAQPEKGGVFLDSEEITTIPMYQRARAGISYLPQEASVFRKLTVAENLLAIIETLGLSAADQKRRLEELLVDLNIGHIRDSMGFALSGGERRRVEIARSLVLKPDFLLLDEPFAGIDPIAVIDIQNIIKQLKERNIGILISDHNVRETLGVCDQAYILNQGQVLEFGTP